jgi:3-oxoacyl-[acyl-carrier protein] reductase
MPEPLAVEPSSSGLADLAEKQTATLGAAIVTGAGSPDGIGFATAVRLADYDRPVVVAATTERIHERAAELRGAGGQVEGFVGDLTDPAAANQLVDFAIRTYGRLDVLVNNAGMTAISDADESAAICDLSDLQWRHSIARNLDTIFFMIRAALPGMRAQGFGRIVNVSSVSGPVMAFPGDPAYHAAKAGVLGLTRSVALEGAPHGVTVNAVAPGWIATSSVTEREMQMGAATPVGRSGTADEVAGLITYLTDSSAGYLTGQLLIVDGGNSIMEERGEPS